MSQIIPTVMVKNEAYFIAAVLRPLKTVFGVVLVGDTGSTDATVTIARAAGAEVHEFGPQTPGGLTDVRRQLGDLAAAHGAAYQLQVDGDEIYRADTLAVVRDMEPPMPFCVGFTTMRSLDGDTADDVWELADTFQRAALLPASCAWSGAYPYDVPAPYDHAGNFFYYAVPAPYRFHAVHVHRLVRSPDDAAVMLREAKRQQFSLRDATVPRVQPFDLQAWCADGTS